MRIYVFMCVFVCVCVCYIRQKWSKHIHKFICTYIGFCFHLWICLFLCIYVSVDVAGSTSTGISAFALTHECVCECVRVLACAYVCIRVCKIRQKRSNMHTKLPYMYTCRPFFMHKYVSLCVYTFLLIYLSHLMTRSTSLRSDRLKISNGRGGQKRRGCAVSSVGHSSSPCIVWICLGV